MECDVVVAGSGSAGLTAAIVAAQAGLEVLLVEKTAYFGGITALSGGGCWVPQNHLMAQVGLTDTREAAERYIHRVVGNYIRPDILNAFLDAAPVMLRHMVETTEVKFAPRTPAPDYYTELDGAMLGGRSLGSVVYDGRKLGAYFSKLRPPLEAFNAPMGLMMGPLEFMHYRAATKSRASAWFMAKLAGRYAVDRLSHARGTRLTMGNALVARLMRSALDAGVTLWTDAPVKALLRDGARVTGATIAREGRDIEVRARRGVVLATGGFSASPEMRRAYYPHADRHQTLVPEGNVGDGLRMAQAAGAAMDRANLRNATPAVVSVWRKPDGSVQQCPHFFMDLPKPGCIAVNQQGRRFGDEANLELAVAMQETGAVPAWLICDRSFLRKYGFGHVWPGGLRLSALRRDGYLHEAQTVRALAATIGVDADALEKTVAANNGYADEGKDLEFGKGDSALDRSMGDSQQTPNPCLGRIETAPFYAIEIFPGDVSSTAGIRVNASAQALDAEDRPIEGLYMCGLDMNSLWAGHGLGNGVYHALNMTFGYIIARHMAQVDVGAHAGTANAA